MSRFRIRNKRSLAVLGALAAVAAGLVWTQVGGAVLTAGDPSKPGVAVAPQAAPNQQVGGTSGHWAGINQTDNPCTTSTSYVDMPGMALTIQTTRLNQRVLITFGGEWISGDERALIRATVDGIVVSGPGDGSAPMSAHDGPSADTNGFTFLSDPIHIPGFHTVRIQWEVVDIPEGSSDEICIDERSLVVQG